MKVIICGSRRKIDNHVVYARVQAKLDELHARLKLTHVLEGGAPGIDRVSSQWAKSRNIPTTRVKADWNLFGPAAGPIRNANMLDMEPTLVIAFPGTNGTENMKKLAREAGVEVMEIAGDFGCSA